MGEGGRGNLVCAVCAEQVLLDLFGSLSVLIKTTDHTVRRNKVSVRLSCVRVGVLYALTNPHQQVSQR